MAKRHPSLVPLSQDHHHGLALALRLRQGSNALLNDGWTHDRNEQAKRVKQFYEKELRRHFQAEEEVVFPEMLKHIPVSSVVIGELITQHRDMEQLIAEIERANSHVLEKALVAFGELLDKHIRLEERDLFEMCQAEFPSGLLDELGRRVAQIHDQG